MGVHIRKSLGYALTGLRAPGGDLADPRVNAGSWLLDHDLPVSGSGHEQDRDSVALVQTGPDTVAHPERFSRRPQAPKLPTRATININDPLKRQQPTELQKA